MNILITDYLDAAVKKYPTKIGFVDESKSITYFELRESSYRIATCLIKEKYYKKPIVVFMDKSIKCIEAFMGIAYSGNFYVPIDIEISEERMQKILDILQPSAIISDYKSVQKLTLQMKNSHKVFKYEDMETVKSIVENIEIVLNKIVDTDLLYILFTSGSTGMPKGVTVSHRSVLSYIEWGKKAFLLDESMIMGNQTPFYFSMSVFDIYQTIRNMGTLFILPRRLFSFPLRLLEFLQEKEINTIYWVPSALCLVANARVLGKRNVDNLKRILFAGEVMPAKQLNIWRKSLPSSFFANLFGPTEVTDICCYYAINRSFNDTDTIPIGIPCKNEDVFLLDESDCKIDVIGKMGELCVRGSFLSYGYYNSPEKTKKAFVQNPLNNGYREYIYRTGDLAHYNEYGELMYDGRKDFQIKHMGYRIELGEIETAISSVDGVEMNCCLYDKQEKQIILFFTGNVNEDSIVERLNLSLPPYMHPQKKIHLREMPINSNGKIDRNKLRKEWVD